MDTTCPNCGTVYEIDHTDYGKTVECEICHRQFAISAPSTTKKQVRIPRNFHNVNRTVYVERKGGCLPILLGLFCFLGILVLGYIVLVMGGCTAGCYSIGKQLQKEHKEMEAKKEVINGLLDSRSSQNETSTKSRNLDEKPNGSRLPKHWTCSKNVDEMTDKVSFIFATEGVGKESRPSIFSTPALIYRVRVERVNVGAKTVYGEKEMYFTAGGFDSFGSILDSKCKVDVRFDNETMSSIDCGLSSSSEAAFPRDQADFGAKFDAARVLRVKAGSKTISFNVAGVTRRLLEEEAVAEIVKMHPSSVVFE